MTCVLPLWRVFAPRLIAVCAVYAVYALFLLTDAVYMLFMLFMLFIYAVYAISSLDTELSLIRHGTQNTAWGFVGADLMCVSACVQCARRGGARWPPKRAHVRDNSLSKSS